MARGNRGQTQNNAMQCPYFADGHGLSELLFSKLNLSRSLKFAHPEQFNRLYVRNGTSSYSKKKYSFVTRSVSAWLNICTAVTPLRSLEMQFSPKNATFSVPRIGKHTVGGRCCLFTNVPDKRNADPIQTSTNLFEPRGMGRKRTEIKSCGSNVAIRIARRSKAIGDKIG